MPSRPSQVYRLKSSSWPQASERTTEAGSSTDAPRSQIHGRETRRAWPACSEKPPRRVMHENAATPPRATGIPNETSKKMKRTE